MPLIAPSVRELAEQVLALKAGDNPLLPPKAQAFLWQLHKGSLEGKSKIDRNSEREGKGLE